MQKIAKKLSLVLLIMLLISLLSRCSVVDKLNELEESIPASLGVEKDAFWIYVLYIVLAIGTVVFFIIIGEKESVIVISIFGTVVCILAFIAFLAIRV